MSFFEHIEPLISIENVSKSFDENQLTLESRYAIKDISLTVNAGEFMIIFGPSGSGKSTLLNVIAGLERPSAGKVLVGGHDLNHYSQDQLARYHRRRMGMVFQSFNLIKSLNVWENVALPQTADGVPYWKRWHKTRKLLKLLGLHKYMRRHPNELSGGEQQRVAIARALINDPLLLLVDEPTGNLDSKSANDVMQILLGLHAHAKHTIILVTHNPDYLAYATRIVYLEDGEIKKQELKEKPVADSANSVENKVGVNVAVGAKPPLPAAEPYNQIRQLHLAERGAVPTVGGQDA